ncbi:unnamed protein product [Adineta steineri]|uniref:Aminopeptidase n=1 Tax=Adineta steineri TaxID=433720 RepID=A0A814BNJ2_9BILA|nr:unnamed protein product [Adineta steineri]CAF0931823.1 unnamed protein product [Adineta steineri]
MRLRTVFNCVWTRFVVRPRFKVLGAIILVFFIIILVKVNSKVDRLLDKHNGPEANAKTRQQSPNAFLSGAIRIEDAMNHLNELQRIATASNGTRAFDAPGFNATIDYITNYLNANTNYKVTKSFFSVTGFALANDPVLISSINGITKNYTYSAESSTADFYHAVYSTSVSITDFTQLTAVPNGGCSDDDWQETNPSPADRVALVKRGICSFRGKIAPATKYNAKAVLLYNDGTSPDRVSPIEITFTQENTIPILFLSFTVGQALLNSTQNAPRNTRVKLLIETKDLSDILVGNICADTPSGDITQTIIIGSHSDSGPEGPGINDNGSGSAANLALAVALARLFQTSTYPKYKYRIRFCWWGAEEIGLLGSDYHVNQAKNTSIVGERLSDYLIHLNYDMLGSPNYIFGIYDASTAMNDTPSQALSGSKKISTLFKNWFIQQNLPWDYIDVSSRSDCGPFLAEGIVVGGLFSGADDAKTVEQRNRYNHILGQSMGGIPDIPEDPCYHKACDSIENINIFVYEKMIKAAAYALEFLGRQEDLRTWLYPSTEIQ